MIFLKFSTERLVNFVSFLDIFSIPSAISFLFVSKLPSHPQPSPILRRYKRNEDRNATHIHTHIHTRARLYLNLNNMPWDAHRLHKDQSSSARSTMTMTTTTTCRRRRRADDVLSSIGYDTAWHGVKLLLKCLQSIQCQYYLVFGVVKIVPLQSFKKIACPVPKIFRSTYPSAFQSSPKNLTPSYYTRHMSYRVATFIARFITPLISCQSSSLSLSIFYHW